MLEQRWCGYVHVPVGIPVECAHDTPEEAAECAAFDFPEEDRNRVAKEILKEWRGR